ncbi:MAG: hypothetical protein JRJ00_00025 [Deltaproteobacteria bacterium]|nr:hypothetical protein [Deltaproteobacteria bacterium]
MEEYTKFNINDYVKVKLNQEGRNIYFDRDKRLNDSYGREIIKPRTPEVDKEGYSKFQMHELMSLYGEHLTIGGITPFETEIYLENKDNPK